MLGGVGRVTGDGGPYPIQTDCLAVHGLHNLSTHDEDKFIHRFA